MSRDGWSRARLRRRLRWSAWGLAALALVVAGFWQFGLSPPARHGLLLFVRADGSLADLRTGAVRERTPENVARGRQLLEEAAARHGRDAWNAHRTVSVTAVDTWSDDNHPWWPAPSQRFRHDALIGTFTSRVELLDGPGRGEVRGLHSWQPYRQDPGADTLRFLDGPSREIEFYLPTLQYFNELPLRLLSAGLVAWAGEREHQGRLFDLVFVTWERWEPHEQHDQYVAWIGRDSGRIEKLHYTLRDAIAMAEPERRDLMRLAAVGTMHFRDFRRVSGVDFPFDQIVTLFGPDQAPADLAEGAYHRVRVESVEFDRVTPQELTPGPDLPAPSAGKPTPNPKRSS